MVPMVPKLIWKAFTPALKVFDYSSIPTAQVKTFAMQVSQNHLISVYSPFGAPSGLTSPHVSVP